MLAHLVIYNLYLYILVYKLLLHISHPPFKKRVPMWFQIVDPCISRRWFFWGLVLVTRFANDQLCYSKTALFACRDDAQRGGHSELISVSEAVLAAGGASDVAALARQFHNYGGDAVDNSTVLMTLWWGRRLPPTSV